MDVCLRRPVLGFYVKGQKCLLLGENLIFYGNEQRNDLCNDACEWGWPVAICLFYLFEQRRVLGRFCYLCGGCRCGAGQPCCRAKSVTADIADTFLGQIHSDLTQL